MYLFVEIGVLIYFLVALCNYNNERSDEIEQNKSDEKFHPGDFRKNLGDISNGQNHS